MSLFIYNCNCVYLCRYFVVHLYAKVEQIRNIQPYQYRYETTLHEEQEQIQMLYDPMCIKQPLNSQLSLNRYDPTLQNVREQVKTLFDLMHRTPPRNLQLPLEAHWPPVDQLLKLGGITLLLQIITCTNRYDGR